MERKLLIQDWLLEAIGEWIVGKILDYSLKRDNSKFPRTNLEKWIDLLGFFMATLAFVYFIFIHVTGWILLDFFSLFINPQYVSVPYLLMYMALGWSAVVSVFLLNRIRRWEKSKGITYLSSFINEICMLIRWPQYLLILAFVTKLIIELYSGYSTAEIELLNPGYGQYLLIMMSIMVCSGGVSILNALVFRTIKRVV